MPTQQRLIELRITRLKSLADVTIEFEERKRLTAILGPNGFGKSTVLHALAASFRPTTSRIGNTLAQVGEDHRFIDFFPNTPHGTWSNTVFSVVHSFRKTDPSQYDHPLHDRVDLNVSKGIGQWKPQPKKRPERETYFIGVSTAVPAIELGWPRSKINYTTDELTDADSSEIQAKAGFILNRDYTRYHTNQVIGKKPSRASLIGVEFQGVNFSALSMGSGEQRLFCILKIVKSAGKFSLILIDELDLLLHTDALHRLLGVLNEYAEKRQLQIIFTTHRESVLKCESFIAIRHLYRSSVAPHKTFCFNDTKPDALTRLTGQPHRPLSICCEDDIAQAIIESIAQQAGLRKFVEISCFGAADNCFTLAGALLLSKLSLDNSIFVLDGDKYTTNGERESRINKALTGDAKEDIERRNKALSKIIQFLPQGCHCPEQELNAMVRTVQQGNDLAENEVIVAASSVGPVNNPHDYVNDVIKLLGDDRSVGVRRIIAVASKSLAWEKYARPLKSWLAEKKAALVESQ